MFFLNHKLPEKPTTEISSRFRLSSVLGLFEDQPDDILLRIGEILRVEVSASVKDSHASSKIFRKFKPKPEACKGLGQLYVNDNRYTKVDGKPNPDFAEFMSWAMSWFVDN